MQSRWVAGPCTLLALVIAPSVSQSQAVGREAATRQLAVVLQHLSKDGSLPDSVRHLTFDALLAPANSGYVVGLDDASTHLYAEALSTMTIQMPTAQCGKMLDPTSGGATDLVALLDYSDSIALARWAILLERLVRAKASGRPGGRIATPNEVQGTMMTTIGQMSPEDQTRLITIARNPPATPADACWSVQHIFLGLAAQPPETIGPTLRAMFGGVATSQ